LVYKKQPENGFSGFQAASEISVAWVANPSRRYFCQTPRCSPDVILAQAGILSEFQQWFVSSSIVRHQPRFPPARGERSGLA